MKWPRWFVPNCSSNPSSVWSWGVCMIPALFIFVIAYMKVEGNESWKLTLSCAFGITIFSIVLFDKLLSLPWPQVEFVDLYVVFDEKVQQPIGNWLSGMFSGGK